MKPKFYLVIDQTAVWGYGKTREAAIRDAEEWILDPEDHFSYHLGRMADKVEDLIISKYESANGAPGFYLEPCYFAIPDNAEELDGEDWYDYTANIKNKRNYHET